MRHWNPLIAEVDIIVVIAVIVRLVNDSNMDGSNDKNKNKEVLQPVQAEVMDRESVVPEKKAEEIMRVRRGDPDRGFFKLAHIVWWILCLGGMSATFIIANTDGPVPSLRPLEAIGLYIFGSIENLKILFNLAVLAHVIEAQIAVYICLVELRLQSWPIWAIQTLLLGYPSLSLLLERKRVLLRGSVTDTAKESSKNK